MAGMYCDCSTRKVNHLLCHNSWNRVEEAKELFLLEHLLEVILMTIMCICSNIIVISYDVKMEKISVVTVAGLQNSAGVGVCYDVTPRWRCRC